MQRANTLKEHVKIHSGENKCNQYASSEASNWESFKNTQWIKIKTNEKQLSVNRTKPTSFSSKKSASEAAWSAWERPTFTRCSRLRISGSARSCCRSRQRCCFSVTSEKVGWNWWTSQRGLILMLLKKKLFGFRLRDSGQKHTFLHESRVQGLSAWWGGHEDSCQKTNLLHRNQNQTSKSDFWPFYQFGIFLCRFPISTGRFFSNAFGQRKECSNQKVVNTN